VRVWTNGKTHLVKDARGLAVYPAGKSPTLKPVGDPAVAAPRPKAGWPRRDVLAAPPSGRVAWVGAPGERSWLVPLDRSGAPKALPFRFLDAVALDEQRVLAAIVGGTEKKPTAKIVSGPVPTEEGAAWERDHEVPKPVKVAWPEPLIWAKAPWSKRAGIGLEIAMSKSPFGAVIAEKESGIVMVMRPDAKAVDFALRVPTQDEATFYGAATPQGVIVVVCVEGRESAACHFDREGKCIAFQKKLGEDACWSMGPPTLLDDARVLVVSAFTRPRLYELELPSLKESSFIELGCEIGGEQSAEATAKGDACLLGFGNEAWVARADGDGWDAERLPAVGPTSVPPAAKTAAGTERVKGPPALTLVPQKDGVRVWSAKRGETLSIEVAFASTGGAGMGVYLELTGPWIAQGKLLPKVVALGTSETPFGAIAEGCARVELPGIELAAAAVPPPDVKKSAPVSATAIFATIRLEAAASGADLLSMRMGPLSAKTRGAGSFAYSKRVEVAD